MSKLMSGIMAGVAFLSAVGTFVVGFGTEAMAGSTLTLSCSNSDPMANQCAPSGGLRNVYLWLRCSEEGVSALEASVGGTLTVLAFVPAAGIPNLGTMPNILLAIPNCPTGPNADVLLGHFLVLDVGGDVYLGASSSTGSFALVGCPPSSLFLPNPEVLGFSSDETPTTIAGNGCGTALTTTEERHYVAVADIPGSKLKMDGVEAWITYTPPYTRAATPATYSTYMTASMLSLANDLDDPHDRWAQAGWMCVGEACKYLGEWKFASDDWDQFSGTGFSDACLRGWTYRVQRIPSSQGDSLIYTRNGARMAEGAVGFTYIFGLTGASHPCHATFQAEIINNELDWMPGTASQPAGFTDCVILPKDSSNWEDAVFNKLYTPSKYGARGSISGCSNCFTVYDTRYRPNAPICRDGR